MYFVILQHVVEPLSPKLICITEIDWKPHMLLCVFQCFLNDYSCSSLLGILHFSLWEVPVTKAELNDHNSHFYNRENKGVRCGQCFSTPDTSKLNLSQNSLYWNYSVAPSSRKFSIGTDSSGGERQGLQARFFLPRC